MYLLMLIDYSRKHGFTSLGALEKFKEFKEMLDKRTTTTSKFSNLIEVESIIRRHTLTSTRKWIILLLANQKTLD